MSHPVRVTVQVEGVTLKDFRSLTISQELFTHHTFVLDFSFEALGKSLGIKPDMVFKKAHEKLSGKSITISWRSDLSADAGRTFKFKGLITETSIRTSADLTNYYHISGASPTFLLNDGGQSRSFVKQSLQQIFTSVLKQSHYASNVLARQLQAKNQEVLPYVVQYDETNFNFLSRLAAQYGEWFYYDGTTLRLGLNSAQAIEFKSNAAQHFTLSMHLQPPHLQGSYYNYRTHQPMLATAKPPQNADPFSKFAVEQSQKVFSQPHRLMADAEHASTSQLQKAMDTLAAKQVSGLMALSGHGEVFDMIPGSLLNVRDADGGDYGKFRVLAVEHELDADGNYQNQFRAMSGALESPPVNEFYAAPAAYPELAEVIDLADDENLGRIRVRFQWPVADQKDAESNWMRVTTPYSGDGKGHLFTPEVGSQVLVSYEHGRPDFPVAIGNLFHSKNKQNAKYTTPKNKLKGLQTAGGNKFVMSDTSGEQSILISNSNNKDTALEFSFKGDGSISIKSKGKVTIHSPKIELEADAGGEIKLHAKTIQLSAEGKVSIDSASDSIALSAGQHVKADAKGNVKLTALQKATLDGTAGAEVTSSSKVDVGKGAMVSVSASMIKLN